MKDLFNITVSEGVYPPSEDTFLLINALDIRSDDFVLDVGCGAGLGTLVASSSARQVLSLDIAMEATKNTKENLNRNSLGRNVSIMQSDLLHPIASDVKFSLIFFNPPYLPAEEEATSMDNALIGGIKGSELTERFITDAAKHLMEGGRLYIVVSSLADIRSILSVLHRLNFDVEVIKEQALFFEKIQVLKGVWKGHKETVL